MDYGIWFFLAGFALAAIGMAVTLHRDSKTINSIQAIANSKNETIANINKRISAVDEEMTKLKISCSNNNTKVNELVSSIPVDRTLVIGDLDVKYRDLEKMCRNIDVEVEFLRQQMKRPYAQTLTKKIELTILDGGKVKPNQKLIFNKVKNQLDGLSK